MTPALVALLGLAACGDNLAPPRLAPARYRYEDGVEEIDRHTLFDRELATLCEPTLFSDGATYCKPPTDVATFADERCLHPLGRVPQGQTPKPYFATAYVLGGQRTASRVFRTGSLTATAPLVTYERQDNLCVAYPIENGFDYYELGLEVTDLPRVHLVDGDVVGEWQLQNLVADGVDMPWRLLDHQYGACNVLARPNHSTTLCEPVSVSAIAYYSDPQCTMPIVTAPERPALAYVGDEGCRQYFAPGLDLLAGTIYQRTGQGCVESSISGPTRQFTVGASVSLPYLLRDRTGTAALRPIVLSPTTLPDEAMFDAILDQACKRDDHLRCVPVGAAAVESWFADDQCGQPIDVAMVPGGCSAATKFAREDDRFYPVLDIYMPQLYQLDTGDTCSPYTPPAGLVAHSIGPALGADAFARATLMIE